MVVSTGDAAGSDSVAVVSVASVVVVEKSQHRWSGLLLQLTTRRRQIRGRRPDNVAALLDDAVDWTGDDEVGFFLDACCCFLDLFLMDPDLVVLIWSLKSYCQLYLFLLKSFKSVNRQ